MDRQSSLLQWVQEQLNDDECYVKPASNDASFRSYWRVFSKATTFIIMDAPPQHENCQPFIHVAKILADAGVHVPQVIAQDLDQGFLLLTDLGTVQYLNVLNPENYLELYTDAIKSLHHIQQNTETDSLVSYNEAMLSQELGLFEKWFINVHLDTTLSNQQSKILQQTHTTLIENAQAQPQIFVHRDFHSRNLMKTKDNNPGILDFQDAVIGAVTYDLVSLLKDCYLKLEEKFVTELSDNFRKSYNNLNNTNIPSQQWQRWFDLMGLQRHLKVVGIFCRLYYRDNKPNYLKDLNLTLCYIKTVCNQYAEFQPLAQLIQELSPSMENICKS